jgi:hypothetical protein
MGDIQFGWLEEEAGRMFTMAKPYPREFRDDVVRVARSRDAGVSLEQIEEFGRLVVCWSTNGCVGLP